MIQGHSYIALHGSSVCAECSQPASLHERVAVPESGARTVAEADMAADSDAPRFDLFAELAEQTRRIYGGSK